MILHEFLVWQHYEDDPPEPFGDVFLPRAPKVSEIIPLHWLDGTFAFNLLVSRVAGHEIHGQATKKHVCKLHCISGSERGNCQCNSPQQCEELADLPTIIQATTKGE